MARPLRGGCEFNFPRPTDFFQSSMQAELLGRAHDWAPLQPICWRPISRSQWNCQKSPPQARSGARSLRISSLRTSCLLVSQALKGQGRAEGESAFAVLSAVRVGAFWCNLSEAEKGGLNVSLAMTLSFHGRKAYFAGAFARHGVQRRRWFRSSRPGVTSRPLSHSITAARLYRLLRPIRTQGGPSPVKAQRSKLRMLRCNWAASSAFVR